MISSLNHKSIAAKLKDDGFCKIDPSDKLKRLIADFFNDICRYILIICEDSEKIYIDDSLKQNLLLSIANDDNLSTYYHINSILLHLAKIDRSLISHIYDMGTRPAKFNSARLLAASCEISEINRSFFNSNKDHETCSGVSDQPLIVNPSNGETLHIFPPGKKEYKYNLPIHQDFPYLLQSSSQLTYWLSLSDKLKEYNGGARLFTGTHKYKIPITTSSKLGHYEVAGLPNQEISAVLKKHDYIDTDSTLFEIYAIDSLLWHQSLKSKAEDSVRMTYIFRYSDISSNCRVKFGVDTSKGDKFENHFSNLYKNS